MPHTTVVQNASLLSLVVVVALAVVVSLKGAHQGHMQTIREAIRHGK